MSENDKKLVTESSQLEAEMKKVSTEPPQDSLDISADKLAAEKKFREEANERAKQVGVIVSADPIPDSDYVLVKTSTGFESAVSRREILERCRAVKDMLLAETGSADPVQMDKDCQLCILMFRAACRSAAQNGKPYSPDKVSAFERQILQAQREWKGKSDFKNKNTRRGKAYDAERY